MQTIIDKWKGDVEVEDKFPVKPGETFHVKLIPFIARFHDDEQEDDYVADE